jgi:hypothetical protein
LTFRTPEDLDEKFIVLGGFKAKAQGGNGFRVEHEGGFVFLSVIA